MTNLYRRSIRTPKQPRRGAFVLSLVTGVVVVLMCIDFVLGGVVRHTARGMLAPIQSAMYAASSALMQQSFWSSRAALMSEVSELHERISQLEGRAAGYEALLQENESLREMAKLAEEQQGITAPIISSFRTSPYGTFLIGAGREQGIIEGDFVLVEGGFVLGKITDVSARSATAQTVFGAGNTLDAVVDSINFSLEGRGGGNARAEVPQESELHEGASVMTPSFGGRPVGVIGKIEFASSSVYSTVHVVFPVNLSSIRYVYVIPGFGL